MKRLTGASKLWIGSVLFGIGLLRGPAIAEEADPPEAFRDCPVCPELITVPAGRFVMGSNDGEPGRPESPLHEVVFARAFAMGRTEVTVREFRRFVESTGYEVTAGCRVQSAPSTPDGRAGWQDRADASWRAPGFFGEMSEDLPVVCVSYADATAYVSWLAKISDKTFRLPSEAEWEYAARAGGAGIYPWGNNTDLGCPHANVYDRSARKLQDFGWSFADCDDGYAELAPVGRFKPNAFGLHDMTGNVWEWTADCYLTTYDTTPRDGSAVPASADCARWTVRGGGWMTRPSRNRITFRGRDPIDARYSYFGFRVARDLE